MRTDVFLTRHGETLWNLEGKFQGWQNSDLTEKGLAQGKNLGRILDEHRIEIIYASPLDRARITAENARGDRDIPIVLLDELKEIGLGQWEGRTYKELEAASHDDIMSYMNDLHGYCPPGGEPKTELVRRSIRARDIILTKSVGKRILVVTHGMTLMTLIHAFSGCDLSEIVKEDVMPQTSITHIVIEDECNPEILLKGDTSHFNKGW